MKSACDSFRTLLEQKLAGRPAPRALTQLSWHEHLVACASCRNLLEREEALELLLATLPEPRLAPDVRRRVLAALARSREHEGALDRLLDLDGAAVAPASLASNVLAGLADAREASRAERAEPLDALLARDSAVPPPPGLAARVLARLAHEREASARAAAGQLDLLLERAGHVEPERGLAQRVLDGVAPARRPVRRPFVLSRSTWVLAAAASLVAAAILWSVWTNRAVPVAPEFVRDGARSATNGDTQVAIGPAAAAPDAQMLAAIDVLENWDLLMQGDVDVLLSTIEPADEALLDYDDEG